MMNGHTKLRNRAIANILNQMGFVESWGTGIKKIQRAAAEYELPEPEFQVYDGMVRVNLFRKQVVKERMFEFGEMGENSEKSSEEFGEGSENGGDTKKRILDMMQIHPNISAKSIAKELHITSRAVEKHIKILRTEGKLIRHGAARGGYWEVRK